jgi:hypothetical protein
MIKLFRVDKDAFVEGHDRESELIHGYMRRAYMMSALRSFAWTLADYCKEHESTPGDIDNSIPSRIANFVASRDWLNYDGKTYCKGLCSGSDLHVYFLPDATSKTDKSKFLPSQEDKDRVKEMKAKLPSYNEILCEVHSLEALRKDLEYIYPAVKVLYDSLAEDRDTSETLEGNESDIVYAWIALAMAAEGPFFTEDGPMNYGFGWPGEEEEWQANWEAEEAARVEEEAEQWMRKYEKYLEDDPVIDFNGSIFVFSGLAGHWAEKDHPTVQKVIEKGGQYRSKVSGLTNYLVVNPGYAGQSKIVAVMEQLQKGKNVKVILLEDLEKALEGKTPSKKASSTSSSKATATKTTTSKSTSTKTTTKSSSTSSTAAAQKATGTKVSKNDCEIDYFDTLTAYNGSAKAIILPDGISAIGEDAFLSNDDITSVVIPEGVETIEDGAFWMCGNLKTVILPSTIRKIGDNAFNSTMLTSIVIPDGCEELGADCFTSCKKLKDIYVPGSVYSIGDDAFCTFNDATVIHTEKYSTAESTAKENGIKVDYKSAPSSTAAASSAKKATSSAKAKVESETEGLAGAMGDLSAQIAEMESQELSAEDQEKLQEIKGLMNDIGDQLAEGQAGLSKYGDYLEQKEAREKAQEEEKARKKAEAMAAGKSEKNIVNMYIILTNEKKLGQLHRAQDKFFEIYEEDFAALSKSEVIQTRKDMLAEMEDESLCSYYAESFKQRSVKDRFTTSTLNLNNVSDEPDFGKKSEFAIENSKEWFTPAEYAEVRKLMDAELADTRKQIDEQLRPIEEKWMKYATATEFLQICIAKKTDDGSDMQESWSCFQHVIGSDLVSVKLSTKGMFKMVTNVMNFNPWYWGVAVRDIWEAARRNEINDEREGAYNGTQLADQALNYIRTKYPETKVSSTTSSYSKPASTSTYTATSTTSSNTSSSNMQRTTTSTTSSPQTQPAKKEGCYIATAVYGSYDAPEVMTLRRFRDETLRNSAFGRWFIRTYYRLSPPVAEKLKNAKRINAFVRSILTDGSKDSIVSSVNCFVGATRWPCSPYFGFFTEVWNEQF